MIDHSPGDHAVLIKHQNFSWGLKDEEDKDGDAKISDKKKRKGKGQEEEILEEDKSTETVALDQSKGGQ